MSSKPKKVKESTQPFYKQLMDQFVNIKSIAVLIVVGTVVISIASFVDSVTKLVKALPEPAKTISSFDAITQEKTLEVARVIDGLCSDLLEMDSPSYDQFKEQYRRIEIELRNLVLRQEARPLNELSAEQQRIVLKIFEEFHLRHRSDGKVPQVYIEVSRKIFYRTFSAILQLEGYKDKK